MGMDRKIEKKTVSKSMLVGGVAAAILLTGIVYTLLFLDSRTSTTVNKSSVFINEVEEGPFQEFIEVAGTVQPIETIMLDAIEGGVVQRVFKQSGEMVQPGDTLITLTNSGLQLNVLQQEAGIYDQINNVRNSRLNLEQNHLRLREQLASSQTELDRLSPQFERDSSLFERELISSQDFEETRQNYLFQKQRYELNLESYRKDSLQMQNQLRQLDQSEERMWRSLDGVQQIMDNLVVTAPIMGQLSTVELNPGQSIRQGEQIGQIDFLDGFKVRLAIDEFYLSRVVTGLRGSFEYAGNRHELQITKIFPVIQDGQFLVDMEFADTIPDDLRRGQTVRVRLELGERDFALLLPRGGFYQHTGGNWIYRLDEDQNRAVRQQIRLGRGNREYFEVLEGLSPGDHVITSGYDTFGNSEVIVLE